MNFKTSCGCSTLQPVPLWQQLLEQLDTWQCLCGCLCGAETSRSSATPYQHGQGASAAKRSRPTLPTPAFALSPRCMCLAVDPRPGARLLRRADRQEVTLNVIKLYGRRHMSIQSDCGEPGTVWGCAVLRTGVHRTGKKTGAQGPHVACSQNTYGGAVFRVTPGLDVGVAPTSMRVHWSTPLWSAVGGLVRVCEQICHTTPLWG